jgi:hypothetical protein
MAMAMALFVAQLAVSRWWLARHRYGPVEWLVRWATTLQRPQRGTDVVGPALEQRAPRGPEVRRRAA